VTAPVGSKSLVDAIGSNLIARAKELTDAGRKALEGQLADGALAQFSRKDRLKRAVAAAGRSKSRSRSRRKSRSNSRGNQNNVDGFVSVKPTAVYTIARIRGLPPGAPKHCPLKQFTGGQRG